MKLEAAREIVSVLMEFLRPQCERIEIGGSIRRGNKDEVKDAELVAIPKPGLLTFLDEMVAEGGIEKALYGEKQTTRWGDKYRGMLYQGLKIELFLTDADSWGYQFWLRTGPGEANTFIMKWLKWKKAPIQSKEGAWRWGNQRLRVSNEVEMFAMLGMPYIEPQNRTEQQYRSILNRWSGKWPDFSKFVIREPIKLRPRVSTPYTDAFCETRDALALEHYQARWPVLCEEIATLQAEIEPIFAELRAHVEKHGYTYEGKKMVYARKNEYAKIYARMADRDWKLQDLLAEQQAMQAAADRLMEKSKPAEIEVKGLPELEMA